VKTRAGRERKGGWGKGIPAPPERIFFKSQRLDFCGKKFGFCSGDTAMKKNKILGYNRQMVFPKIKIKVLGIGGGGGSIVSEAAKSLTKINFTVVDTDFRALKRVEKFVKCFPLGKDITYGLGTGMNPTLAQKVAIAEKERISKILKGYDLVILVSSLGGGVGSGISPVFAEISQSLGNKTFGFFILPFKFEGERKAQIALDSLELMKNFLNVQIRVPNENIFKVIDKNISIQQALFLVNEILIKNLKELINIIYKPGLINVDFADLQTILSKRGKSAFLNTITSKGEKKIEKITQDLFLNPLLPYDLLAERILFNITGGKDLKMLEVEKISKAISRLNPRAKIIFGISKESNFKDQIKTTLLIVGSEKKIKIPLVKGKKKEIKGKTQKKPKEKHLPLKTKPKVFSQKPKTLVKSEEKKLGKKTKEAPKEEKHPTRQEKSEKSQEIGVVPETKKIPLRRNAIEIKKAQKLEELEKLAQEKELEVPTFLRKKFSK